MQAWLHASNLVHGLDPLQPHWPDLSPDPDCSPHSILLKRCRLRTNTNAIDSRVRLCNTPEAWRMSVYRRPRAKERGFETSSRNESTQRGMAVLWLILKLRSGIAGWYPCVWDLMAVAEGDGRWFRSDPTRSRHR